MNKIIRFSFLLMVTFISLEGFSQNQRAAVNYLNTPAELIFSNTPFHLVWSSHPNAVYYKQEYLPKGETLNKFTNMLLLEVLVGKTTIKDAIATKIAELQTMKASNPFISYDSSYNAAKEEYFLDFVLTANTPDGKGISIAERNVYRYKKYSGKNGETGVLLVGVSKRSYGTEAAKFISGLSAKKQELVNEMKQFSIPTIMIKN